MSRNLSNENESSSRPSGSAGKPPRNRSDEVRRGSRPETGSRLGDLVAVGRSGKPIGESNPRAKYTDLEVDEVLVLRDEGFGFGTIARLMDMPKSTIWSICIGRTRAQHAVRWKKRHAK